jgi:hypothetical protein
VLGGGVYHTAQLNNSGGRGSSRGSGSSSEAALVVVARTSAGAVVQHSCHRQRQGGCSGSDLALQHFKGSLVVAAAATLTV